MRPPGIAMQLDELEYFLPRLYPGVVLAVEGKLPFRGLEERLHDGVIARAALARKRSDEPEILEFPAKPARGILAAPIHVHHESFFRIFPVHSVVKGVDYQILVDAGGTLAIRLSCERAGRGRWPGRAILPSWACGRCRRATRCSSFGRRIPRSRHWPLCPRPSAPSVLPGAPAGCQPLPRHHTPRGLAVRDDADLAKLDDDPPRPASAIVGAEDVLDEQLQRLAGYLPR